MFIKKLILQEGIFQSIDLFDNVNLIYSRKNSCGKSTYLRFLFYALGYPIPAMKGVDYQKVSTELQMIEKGTEYIITRTSHSISIESNKSKQKIVFSLPNEHNAFLGYVFDSNKTKVLNNIIGIMYVDQEKGWSLLNRGTVIGKIKFSIEELLAGLSDKDNDSLLERKKLLKNNEKKYQAMLNINELSEEVYRNNGEIFITDVEKTLTSKISLIDLRIRDVREKILSVENAIKAEEDFWKFVDSMRLQVMHNDELITVNRENVVYSTESIEYMKARKSLLDTDLHHLTMSRATMKNKLNDYYAKNTELTKSMEDTQDVLINRQLSTFSFDQDTVNKLLAKTISDLKNVNIEIQNSLKANNIYIMKIYNYVKEYAKKLKIGDIIDVNKDYIFTTDLKSLSGAVLQKLVFAFKVAFLKVIEEVLDTKLIMILDSPRGKELDNNNLKLIMNIVNSDLKDNQVFIASIYDDFHYTKKIELNERAIEFRQD